MPLDTIGAGFGRTGTESMKRALEILGFGPCYHMYEVIPRPDRFAQWQAIFDDPSAVDWEMVFDGYRATVDWPAAHFWRALVETYPSAKVILTLRPAAEWYASMDKTILPRMRDRDGPPGLSRRLVETAFDGNVIDRDHVIAVYERHNRAVRDTIPPERLLCYELGSGWAPLCRFLGRRVPTEVFPSGNSAVEFHRRGAALERQCRAVEDGLETGLPDAGKPPIRPLHPRTPPESG